MAAIGSYNHSNLNNSEQSVMNVNSRIGYNQNGKGQGGSYKPRLSKEERKRLKCTFCEGTGHERNECFKLNGVPEWYKKLKEEKGQKHAHCVIASRPEERKILMTVLQMFLHMDRCLSISREKWREY